MGPKIRSFYFSLVLSFCMVSSEVSAQQDWQKNYKVGDSIELFIAEGLWQKGVVTENAIGGTMRVKCEDFVSGNYRRKGGVYIVYGKSDIRKLNEAAPTPPSVPPLPANPNPKPSPGGIPGALLKQQPPQVRPGATEAYFKRLIYEQYRDKRPQLPIGIIFHNFAVAESYANELVDDVPRHMTAAVGAMIYRVRTSHDVSVQDGDGILQTKIVEGYFIISQDKTGNWFAAPDGKKSWTQERLPMR